ncbi:MAG: hypothetical protein IKJ51_00055, partial [Clostridia bacterium]|nr:hypothetical protein [Clostridia bacterium]
HFGLKFHQLFPGFMELHVYSSLSAGFYLFYHKENGFATIFLFFCRIIQISLIIPLGCVEGPQPFDYNPQGRLCCPEGRHLPLPVADAGR